MTQTLYILCKNEYHKYVLLEFSEREDCVVEDSAQCVKRYASRYGLAWAGVNGQAVSAPFCSNLSIVLDNFVVCV